MAKYSIPYNKKCFTVLLHIIFIISFFFSALYHEAGSAFISLCLFTLLIWGCPRGIKLKINPASVSVFVLVLFYFISAFWAVDSETALQGGVRVLPVLLFMLCLMQISPEDRVSILKDIPDIGVFMTAISLMSGFIPTFSEMFRWEGRLAGFFDYPNTYACFLLVGFLILLITESDKGHKMADIISGTVLVFGIIQSGSRTVFILAVPSVLAALLIRKDLQALFVSAVSVISGCLLNFAASFLPVIGESTRILAISSQSTSLLSRLLFWKDAIPVILKNPLGLGYMGYSFIQGSVQTGCYNVKLVHGSFLQILLDVGWIPAVLVFTAVICTLASKHVSRASKLLLTTLILHCLVDFDLEYTAMYFIILCLLDLDSGRETTLRIPVPAKIISAVPFVLFGFYIGAVSELMNSGRYGEAYALCPWNTTAEVALMESATDTGEKKRLAEDILSRNEYVSAAWSVLASEAYEEDRPEEFMEYQKKAISVSKYNIRNYDDYFIMLSKLYKRYSSEGDETGAEVCLSEIASIDAMLGELEEKTDDLAYRISDKPTFTMPAQYYVFLEEHGLRQ